MSTRCMGGCLHVAGQVQRKYQWSMYQRQYTTDVCHLWTQTQRHCSARWIRCQLYKTVDKISRWLFDPRCKLRLSVKHIKLFLIRSTVDHWYIYLQAWVKRNCSFLIWIRWMSMRGSYWKDMLALWHFWHFDRDVSGFTPLHYAIIFGNDHLIEPLIKCGADVNAQTTSLKLTRKSRQQQWIHFLQLH